LEVEETGRHKTVLYSSTRNSRKGDKKDKSSRPGSRKSSGEKNLHNKKQTTKHSKRNKFHHG